MVTSRAELIVRKTHYKLKGIQSGLKHLSPNPLNTIDCAGQKMLHFCTMRNKQPQIQIPWELIFASMWNFSFPLPCCKYENFASKSKMSLQSCQWREFLVKSLSFFYFFFLTVNGGYSHCSLISEKKNMMDMEMTSGSVPVCRQGLFLHTGNSLARDHVLSRERLLHVGQLNLAHSDLRYHSRCYQLLPLAPPQCHGVTKLLPGRQGWYLHPTQCPPHGDLAGHHQTYRKPVPLLFLQHFP